MAGLARAAAGALRRAGLALADGAQRQQRRAAHDLHAHTNKHVENWLSRREDIEREFKWDGPTTRAVLILGIAMPIATYNMLVWQAHKDDDYAERPRRDFLWGHAERGPGA